MALEWYFCTVDKLRPAPLGYKTPLEVDKPISFIRDCYGSSCSNHALSQIHQSSQLQLYDHVHVTDKPKYLNSTYVSVETRLTADCQ